MSLNSLAFWLVGQLVMCNRKSYNEVMANDSMMETK